MMDSKITKNKRIAKNTLLLYVRMLFLMIVHLYTSRVVLQVLGIEDYGVYNAVAGFIALFSMVSNSISAAISRYITFVLGTGNQEKLQKVFCTALIIQVVIALVVLIAVEAFGVWFLNTQMTIPSGRLVAANWVLQFALLTFVFNLWSTPYNATIVAHEKMGAFAYIGIFDGCAKLAVAFLILISPIDRLVFYALLMCLISFATRLIYTVYCNRNFEECKFRWVFDRTLFREMFGFAGWNFIGCTSGVLLGQGVNILFNVYFGPVVNAARGLTSQVLAAVSQFTANFYVAVQPQITKSFACNDFQEAHSLVARSSRLGFLMMMFLAIPLIMESGFVLGIWLKEVPEHTSLFVKILLIDALFCSFSEPLIKLLLATGKIKKYQILVGGVNMLNFPVAWLVLYLGGSPELVLMSTWAFSIAALMLRLYMLHEITHFPVRDFLLGTVLKCVAICVLCMLPAICISCVMTEGLLRFCVNVMTSECMIVVVVFLLGLNIGERKFIISKVSSMISSLKR